MSKPRIHFFRLGKLCGLAVLSIMVVLAILLAQPSERVLDLRSYGFDIPPGKVAAASHARVTTLDEQGRPVVAQVRIDVGNYHLVMLPDGQLVARSFVVGHRAALQAAAGELQWGSGRRSGG